ncbi:MAG: hypothetical protein LIP01_01600 [Tannerellaceae bacterium]|nr:hypothetical protein [Tannerellaceae bacterium]
MKRVTLLFCSLICLLACQEEKKQNSISGHVQGIQVGDKVVLVMLDPQTTEPIILDHITVSEENTFNLSTKEKGTMAFLYLFDKTEELNLSDFVPNDTFSWFFLEGYDDLKITGNREDWSYLDIEGGLYSLPEMQEINRINSDS